MAANLHQRDLIHCFHLLVLINNWYPNPAKRRDSVRERLLKRSWLHYAIFANPRVCVFLALRCGTKIINVGHLFSFMLFRSCSSYSTWKILSKWRQPVNNLTSYMLLYLRKQYLVRMAQEP
jgi:hypothetical protein